jgi:hypothetical protein
MTSYGHHSLKGGYATRDALGLQWNDECPRPQGLGLRSGVVDTAQGRAMTEAEVANLWNTVDQLLGAGWGIPDLADALAYRDPSSLYSARRERRGITIGRYREVCRIHAEGRNPVPRTPRTACMDPLTGERFAECEKLISDLEKKGYDKTQLARIARYASTAGLHMAVRRRSLPADAYEKLADFATRKGVRPAPPSNGNAARSLRMGWTALDYLDHVADLLSEAAGLIPEATARAGTMAKPWFRHFGGKVGTLAKEARDAADGQ